MSFVSSAFSALVRLICGQSQHTFILPHINPNLSLSLRSYRFLVWLELFVPSQALVGFSGILQAFFFAMLMVHVRPSPSSQQHSFNCLCTEKLETNPKKRHPLNNRLSFFILFCLYSYTLRVVGNGIKAQAENPEVKVKEADPVINQVIDKLKHINQVSLARKNTIK